jgi:hypothetical protein
MIVVLIWIEFLIEDLAGCGRGFLLELALLLFYLLDIVLSL